MADDIQYKGKGKILLCELAEALDDPQNLKRAARVLNSVLYGVTNMLSFEDGIVFLRAIPLYAKGIHQWGWQVGPNNAEQAESMADLEKELININQAYAKHDFPEENSTHQAIKAVFQVLIHHIPDDRLTEAKAKLPPEVASYITPSTVSRSYQEYWR